MLWYFIWITNERQVKQHSEIEVSNVLFVLELVRKWLGDSLLSFLFCSDCLQRSPVMLAASVVIIRDGSSEPINPPTGYWPDITLITPDIINYWFLLSPTKHFI